MEYTRSLRLHDETRHISRSKHHNSEYKKEISVLVVGREEVLVYGMLDSKSLTTASCPFIAANHSGVRPFPSLRRIKGSAQLIGNFHPGITLDHAFYQLVKLIKAESSVRSALLTDVKISTTADSTMVVNVHIRNP
jgi:hypothetical protein